MRNGWIVPFLCVLVLALAAPHVRQSGSAALPTPPGKLVDLGGRKLHINCSGRGPATVIVENGASSFSIDWELVRPKVAETTRVCVYDRAGYGWSDPTPKMDWAEDVVQDLFAGLRKAGEHPPFVLAGQSIGGLFPFCTGTNTRSKLPALFWWTTGPSRCRSVGNQHHSGL